MGVKYPLGESPVYPPRDWTCPKCGHYHSKPHFSFKGQIDDNLEPNTEGRVKFSREEKFQDCGDSMTTGPQFGKDENQRPIFCPHCGWIDTVITIVKVRKKK